jgi:hypothetical protein
MIFEKYASDTPRFVWENGEWVPATKPDPNPNPILCPHCKKDHLHTVEPYEPWNDSHHICPLCHSTYNIFEFPKPDAITTNPVVVK